MTAAPFASYQDYDGLGLAELVRRGEVSPAELVEAAIARIEACDGAGALAGDNRGAGALAGDNRGAGALASDNRGAGALAINAVVHRHFERARAAAMAQEWRGPFQGVPFLLKDLLANDQGTPISQGSRFFAGQIAAQDSEVVRRCKAAGLVPLGKTNTPELGLLPVTEPALHGPTRNPWDRARAVGGSSGGAAAAVAAGMVPLAHASDGGGSIRIPASCCGVFGLKPTRGRSPFGPDIGEAWHGLAVEHVVTRSVRDSAAFLDLLGPADEGAPYAAPPPERPFLEEVGRDPGRLRVAFTTASLLGKQVDPEVAALTRGVAALCQRLGHIVDEQAPPLDRRAVAQAYLTIVAAETAAWMREGAAALGRPLRPEGFEPATWFLAQIGQHLSAVELAMAVHRMHALGREMARWFRRYDVLLTPVLSAPPPRIGALALKPAEQAALRVFRALPSAPLAGVMRRALPLMAEQLFEYAAFTQLANLTGQPAMSVPLSWTAAGLPVGAHFIARFGDEATLLRLAAQLEQAQPWSQRRPAL